ncbi:MAG: hypothetical protein ACRBG0_01235 [Lewinella sp.]|uniref:hypothetical protein n=1 Tax=Lewinella sp. TaxID=2004506 RepID=UPI003D6AB58B
MITNKFPSQLVLILLYLLFLSSCKVQETDLQQQQIFINDHRQFGVKNASGKVIIKPIYAKLFPYFDIHKIYYEQADSSIPQPYPYYIAENADGQLGILSGNGRLVFGFITAHSLEIDLPTKTVVVGQQQANATTAYQLYFLNGSLADTSTYRRIGYFEDNELIILEKQRDEVYLWNIDTPQKLGPYDHFNRWAPHNMLAVRYQKRWGLITSVGQPLLPMDYTRLWIMNDEYASRRAFVRAEKPAGVTFIGGATLADGRTQILLDENLKEYSIDVQAAGTRIIPKID